MNIHSDWFEKIIIFNEFFLDTREVSWLFGLKTLLMGSKMSKSKSRKKFNDLFKTQAVEMAAFRGDIPGVAQELQIDEANLRRWIADPRNSSVATQGPGQNPTTTAAETAQEMKLLRRELALLRAENQVLKKAAIIMGSSHGS